VQHDIIPVIQNISSIKEVLLMQDLMQVSLDIWADYDPEKRERDYGKVPVL
jgi:hypothetical protein